MNKIIKNKKGFTIVETLVALSILLVGITAVMSVSQIGLGSIPIVRNRVTGIYLAQEALDGVKNIKDGNLLSNSYWLKDLDSCYPDVCGYDVENNSTGRAEVANFTDLEVKINDQGLYSQSATSGNNTGFTRQIFIRETVPNKEAWVYVRITMPGGRFVPFEITEYIYKYF